MYDCLFIHTSTLNSPRLFKVKLLSKINLMSMENCARAVPSMLRELQTIWVAVCFLGFGRLICLAFISEIKLARIPVIFGTQSWVDMISSHNNKITKRHDTTITPEVICYSSHSLLLPDNIRFLSRNSNKPLTVANK